MANKLPTTSLGKLLRQLKKTPMTRKQMTQFLLKNGNGFSKKYIPATSGGNGDYYNSTLYGTRNRVGFLERYGRQLKDGRWTVNALAAINPDGPYVPQR